MPAPKKQSPRPSDAESLARKKEILRRADAGESVIAVAKDLGVSKAYAYSILQKRREQGTAAVETQGRGKRKDQPLTIKQQKELVKTVRETHPWEHGIASGMWSEPEIKEWLLKNHQRTISVGQIRSLGMQARLRWRPLSQEEWKHIPLIPMEEKASEESPIDALPAETELVENDYGDIEMPSLDQWEYGENLSFEEMQESVAETRKLLAKKNINYGGSRAGVRTGKHKKQRAPQQKKKKRKKR